MASRLDTAAVVRAAFTAVVVLLAAVILWYCALVGLWVWSTAGSPQAGPGGVLGSAVVLSVIALLAIGAVLVQLKWSNRATEVAAIVRRSLLALAGPGAVILVSRWLPLKWARRPGAFGSRFSHCSEREG